METYNMKNWSNITTAYNHYQSPRGNSSLPWNKEKEPYFSFSLGWGTILLIIIVAIVIITVFWVFTGGKERQFIGIPNFAENKPSEILDEETMNILNITDPLTRRINNQSERENNSDRSGYSYHSNGSGPQSGLRPGSSYRPRSGSSRSRSNDSNSSSNSHRHTDNDDIDFDLDHALSQPASVLLPSGRIESMDHMTPRPQSQDDSEISNQSTYIPINSLREDIGDNSPTYIRIPTFRRPISAKTPRYEDLDIGTFKERKTKAESRGERICREFLENYYRKPFKRDRPDFLVNPTTGRNLELDGYNAELAIAFEYNGHQHYYYPNHFHKGQEEFEQQLRRDNYKRESCDRSGVYLITVSYTIPHDRIPEYIRSMLPNF